MDQPSCPVLPLVSHKVASRGWILKPGVLRFTDALNSPTLPSEQSVRALDAFREKVSNVFNRVTIDRRQSSILTKYPGNDLRMECGAKRKRQRVGQLVERFGQQAK